MLIEDTYTNVGGLTPEKISNTNVGSKDKVKNRPNINLEKFLRSTEESSTNFFLDENAINEKRMKFLKEKVTPQLLSFIKEEDFEFGQKSESINLVEKQIQINAIATKNWFNELYLNYFRTDRKILLSLLRIVEYFDKELLFPTGQTMAISALVHSNDEVKELGVRILENGCSVESYEILKNIKVDTKWLQQYINRVILDLEKELCLI
ncbi:MAG: hypothetical protein GDA42_00100 [Ekhidna sp.]|nr:hypothetical protein [Ekhidna sp.]MBC6408861.1 hypothetical protein [Ekhidna sp.]